MEVVRLDENHRSTPQVVAAATAALGRTVSAAAPLGGRRRPDAGGHGLRRRRGRGRGGGGVAARPVGGRGGVVGPGGAGPDPRPAGHRGPGPGPGRDPPPHGAGSRIAARGARCSGGARPDAAGPRTGPRQGRRRPTHRRCRTARSDGDVVELATFHRAKGLEWESVHVVGPRGGLRAHRLRRVLGGPGRGATPALRGPHPGLPGPPLLVGALASHGQRPLHGPAALPWLAAVARVSRAGTGRAPRPDADRMIAEMRAGLGPLTPGPAGPKAAARRGPGLRCWLSDRSRQSSSTSMNTGAWSEGFSPLRAFRSMRA